MNGTFEKTFRKVLRKANAEILMLATEMKMKNQKLLFSNENLEFAMKSREEIIRILNEAGYPKTVNNFLKTESLEIKEYMKGLEKSTFAAKFVKSDVAMIKALQKKDLLSLLDLEDSVAKKIQQTLIQGVMTGMTKKEMATKILKKTNVAEKYVNTYVETSRNQYLQKLHDMSAKNWKEETGKEIYWEYVGAPLDDKTRPECEEGLEQRYFTDAEKLEFESTYGVRWNCRHSFVQITEERYNAA